MSPSSPANCPGLVYPKETLDKGKPAHITCIDIMGQTFHLSGGPLRILRLEDEWFDDVRDPEAILKTLRQGLGIRPDLFTFWQRPPDFDPRYPFHMEWEDLAVLPIKSYDHWMSHQIKPRVRGLVRKAEKEGIVVKETVYDDAFVQGMTTIFNESPVRQGRKFWHYGKSFETLRSQFSRYIDRETMIGAYLNGELIGFIMLGDAGNFGLTGQIISSLKHRDKATNNALIAKAVEICAARGLQFLIYLYWSDDSLSEFKRRCGFEKTRVPRYYVPLTTTGRLALKCGLHRGWKEAVPKQFKAPLKRLRRFWSERIAGRVSE